MNRMKIEELLTQIDYLNFSGDPSYEVSNITYNSKKADAYTIFAAIRGFKQDGHLFINEAKRNGCKVFLCERLADPEEGVSTILVNNSRSTMADISYLLKNPNENISLTGVTGTNGKTSITYLLKKIFDHYRVESGVIGSMGVLIGNRKQPLENTTPEAPDLHDLINEMKKRNITHCLMEVSSHATELFRVKKLKYLTGIFTNLTEDHLILHKTMENYYQAKKKFFYQCEGCIINTDDHYGARLYKELTSDGLNVISYSSDKASDYVIKDIRTDRTGSVFNLLTAGCSYRINLRTPGTFNVYNNVAAIAAAARAGFEITGSISALEQNRGVEGRFEFIETKLDCTVIVDFAHTPDGLEKVMETIEQFATGRKVVMFGGQGERDRARRAKMGEVAGRHCDFIMLTPDNPVNEDPSAICREIITGVEKHHKNHMTIIDREQAIHYLIKNHQPGDTILLAGKSTEYYQMIGDRKVPFFEKKIAQQAIKEAEAALLDS
jgi:UDP-N-acetylmuramoyl-L-alanyl-D-glutamate--2,6-diaminopimelate ligase